MLTETKIKSILCMTKSDNRSAGIIIEDYGIFEMIKPQTDEKPCFALATETAPFTYAEKINAPNDKKYEPFERVPWTLPNEPEPYESTEKLFEEIKDFLYTHLETPKSDDLTVIAAWILHTWTLEKSDTTAYLFFYGVFESGKSRALELLQELGFRAWLATGITTATLFRAVEEWQPSLLLDESETFINRPEISGLLNAGYKRNTIVPRQTQKADGTYETEWFDLFCPKAIAGTEDILRTTKSRCITFKMSKAARPIPIFIDKEKACTLRNKLLQWRFDQMLDCEAREPREAATGHEGIEELSKVSSGRLTELFLPLYQVTPSKYRKEILNYVQNLRQERTREMGLSEEVLVLASILECEKQGMTQKGLILIKHITERINKQSDYQEQYTNQQLGQIIGRLGFEKQHTRQGNALVWNEGLIKKLESDPRYETCFKPVEVSDQYPTEGSQASQLNYFEDTENSENKNCEAGSRHET